MIPLKFVSNKVEKSFNLPESWEEITIKQFLGIRELKREDKLTPLSLMAVMSGIPEAFWHNVKTGDVEQIQGLLFWFIDQDEPDWDSLPMPEVQKKKVLEIDGEEYEIPKSVENLPWGAVENMKETINRRIQEVGGEATPNDLLTTIPALLAWVFQPFIDREEGEEAVLKPARIGKIIELTEGIPAVKAYPVGGFFLQTLLLQLINGINSLNGSLSLRKSRRELTS